MQVCSSSFHTNLPLSPSESSNSSYHPLFLRGPSECLESSQIIPNIARSGSAELISVSVPLKSVLEPRSPRRFSTCGFSPLPSIIASPICTPTCSTSSHCQGESLPSSSTPAEPATASLRILFPPATPTWIATPPTPPSKTVRRSNTTVVGRFAKSVSPSASFPASMSAHGTQLGNTNERVLKRSMSFPCLFSETRECYMPLSIMGKDLVQSPKTISPSNNPFDATFSAVDGSDGPGLRRRDTTGLHSKAIFRLSSGPLISGDEDDDTVCNRIDECSLEDPSPAESWSDHSVEDLLDAERCKDAFRRYHALKELLATEVGYLADLRALVTVYLRSLPILAARSLTASSTFSRASSFTSGPWIHSYSQLQAVAVSSSSNLPETQNSTISGSLASKEPSRASSRYLFSDAELEMLTRNAEEILQLHEHFVRELRIVLEPLGIIMEHEDEDYGHRHLAQLDAAIRAVSTKFATEASRFTAYQSFCTGHPEAMSIIRKASHQYPIELEAFEQRCAIMVSDMMDAGTKAVSSEPKPTLFSDFEGPLHQARTLSVDDRTRMMSSSSLDSAPRTLRSRPSILLNKDSVVFPTETRRDKSTPRIAFTDYMIKPIQRICKYPLLLDQLLPSKALRTLTQNSDTRSDVNVVVESAAQAMRHVAASVDEARHRQDIAMQSALIFTRICIASTQASGSPFVQVLTPEFFASLGNCLLSGSLDVMHYHLNRPLEQFSNIKARYFGAFLYKGGYLVLVKVLKGRKYEPKHWFSLADFEVSDVEDEGSWLPCSFTLSSGNQHFELAAACQREKDAWLSAIHEALTHIPSWVGEPTPSFKVDDRGELLQHFEDDEQEPQNGLATIRSIPELGHTSDPELSEPFFASLRHGKSKKKWSRCETPHNAKVDIPPPPSRRTSSTSVKAIFSPMSSDHETVLIRRSSPAARHHVDQELQDVTSQSILTARSYAFSHEVELFQAPKTGFSRSNSGIGMSRLSKHESVRVPRRRTTESLDSSSGKGSSPMNKQGSGTKRNRKKLSVTSIEYDTSVLSCDPATSPDHSPTSSRTHSRIASQSSSSTLPIPLPVPPVDLAPMKQRSFVRNVRGIFQLRPTSPVSVIISQPSQPSVPTSAPLSGQCMTPYNALHRWTKDPFRRRARSVNDEPENSDALFNDPEKRFSLALSRTEAPLST